MDEFSEWSDALLEEHDVILRADQPIVCHLNGRNFRHFTQRLDKPYDEKFQDAMIETSRRLAHQCGANFVFTAYDTITLVRYHTDSHTSIWCGNSRDRIITTTASFAAMFLEDLCRNAGLDTTWHGAFSAKAFNAPTRASAAVFLTCVEREFQRRALTTMARHYLGKEPAALKERETKDRLRASGHSWECMPARFKLGIAFKMRKVHPTEENGQSMRHELRTVSTPLYFHDTLQDIMFEGEG